MIDNLILVPALLALFLVLENIFPLRQRRDENIRFLHNFLLAILSLPITRLLILPLILNVADTIKAHNLGLLNIYKLSITTHHLLGFIILDGTLYWWHLANHKISFFWRFHQVHHADRDMDSTTALRFHFGELLLAGLVRCGLILIVGLKIQTVIVFDLLVTSAALFHHSNLKLPVWLDKKLSLIIVTPLYHQNHHSYFQEETDSNYSTIFSFWDRLFRSFSGQNLPKDIIIGYPAYSARKLKFNELIVMPFATLLKWPVDWKKRS